MKKRSLVTLGIIFAVIILSLIILTRSHPDVSEELAYCIGQNSVLYMQTGCHACEIQEQYFGENVKFLNTINCWIEGEKCLGIKGTPTWIINGEEYLGARSVEELKELTNC